MLSNIYERLTMFGKKVSYEGDINTLPVLKSLSMCIHVSKSGLDMFSR